MSADHCSTCDIYVSPTGMSSHRRTRAHRAKARLLPDLDSAAPAAAEPLLPSTADLLDEIGAAHNPALAPLVEPPSPPIDLTERLQARNAELEATIATADQHLRDLLAAVSDYARGHGTWETVIQAEVAAKRALGLPYP